MNILSAQANKFRPLMPWLGLFLAVWVLQILFLNPAIMPGRCSDPDGYMRLARVQAWHDGGGWYDELFRRSNPPEGEVLHWTRPLDIILRVGAEIGAPPFGFRSALDAWGYVVSPFLQMLGIVGLVWAARPFFKNRETCFFAAALFLLEPAVIGTFSLARPDHHSLFLCLFVFIIGAAFRAHQDEMPVRYAVLAGLLTSLSLWVGVETLPLAGAILVSLGLCWAAGIHRDGTRLLGYAASLWAFSSLVMLADHPPQEFFRVEFDKISFPYFVLFSLSLMLAATLHFIVGNIVQAEGKRGAAVRFVFAVVLSATATIFFWKTFPSFLKGPLSALNPFEQAMLWDRLEEMRPLFEPNAAGIRRFLIFAGNMLLAVPVLAWILFSKDSRDKRPLYLLATLFVVYLPAGIIHLRMAPYINTLVVFPLAMLIERAEPWIASFFSSHLVGVVRVLAVMVMALFFPTLSSLVPMPPPDPTVLKTAIPHIKDLCHFIENDRAFSDRVLRLVNFPDYSSEILWRTRHEVVSSVYHRNPSLLFDYYVLASEDMEKSKKLLRGRGVTTIAISPPSLERKYYRVVDKPDSLYRRLADGHPPDWAKPIRLPEKLARQFLLFAVEEN